LRYWQPARQPGCLFRGDALDLTTHERPGHAPPPGGVAQVFDGHVLRFERRNTAMQLFDIDRHGYPPRGNRRNDGWLENDFGTLARSS